MRKKFLYYLFPFLLLLELYFIYNGQTEARYVTKPALMLVLLMLTLAQPVQYPALKNLLAGAVFLSLAGDIALMFDSRGELYFITGLICFLLAHLSYILLFQKIRLALGRPITNRAWVYYAFAITAWVVVSWLYREKLDKMTVPVIVYGATLVTMVWMIPRAFGLATVIGRVALLGGLLFIFSDGTLAYNKFIDPLPSAGVIVMLTYGLAQWLIVGSAIRCCLSIKKR